MQVSRMRWRGVGVRAALVACVVLGLVGAIGPVGGRAEKEGGTTPATDPLAVLPRIGTETYDSNPTIFAGIAEATGGGYARMHVGWRDVEPNNTTPDNFDWSWYDYLFGMARAQGVKILITVVGCPEWACPNANGPLNEGMDAEVAQFTGALAARYRQAPYDVHAYELWNEPNLAIEWGQQAPDRLALLGLVGEAGEVARVAVSVQCPRPSAPTA